MTKVLITFISTFTFLFTPVFSRSQVMKNNSNILIEFDQEHGSIKGNTIVDSGTEETRISKTANDTDNVVSMKTSYPQLFQEDIL